MTSRIGGRLGAILLLPVPILVGAGIFIGGAEWAGIDPEQRRFLYPMIVAVAVVTGIRGMSPLLKRNREDPPDS